MKIILVDPYLVHTFFGNNFLTVIMVRTLENNYFLTRTKLGYSQYFNFLGQGRAADTNQTILWKWLRCVAETNKHNKLELCTQN